MDETIAISLSLLDPTDAAAIGASEAIFVDGPRRADPPLGALPEVIGVMLVGLVTVSALGSHLAALACRLSKKGIIVDAAVRPIEVREVDHLPGGTVLVFDREGGDKVYDVCNSPVDLTSVLATLISPKSS